jgi:hypothetical protein
MVVLAGVHAPSLRTPFRHAVVEALRAKAFSAQQVDCIERHHAVGAAAVRDDVATFPQLLETLRQISERERDRTGKVPRHVFLTRSNIDQRDLTATNPPYQFVVVDGLERAARVEKLVRELLDFGQPRLREVAQFEEECVYSRVRKSVRDVEARLLGVHETGPSEDLKMVRGRRHALTGLLGERFDGPRAL